MEIAVTREGQGPEVLLVHGGAGPATTWSGLDPLKARWTLAIAYRRGFSPSPAPPEGCQDFDLDADDLEPLLAERPLPEGVVRAMRRAHGGRPPSEARPRLDALLAGHLVAAAPGFDERLEGFLRST